MNYFSNKLESNKIKIFFHIFSGRRNFIPLLSIYFLTLPNTHANMLGVFTGIGYIAGFLFEIPSSYLADTFGHKKNLILVKISSLISTACFILGSYTGDAFFMFTLGSIFMSLAVSLDSGTVSAFFHNTLVELKQDSEFTKILSKIKANVSLLSVLFIVALPFFTKISILIPFYIALFIDILGFINSTLLVSPNKEKPGKKEKNDSILKVIKDSYDIGFLPFAIFFGVIMGVGMGSNPFKIPYLEDLGYPVIFIGFVMGLSRIIRFIIGHHIHHLEKYLKVKEFLIIEILINVGLWFLLIIFNNPYVVGFVFSLFTGYGWGRMTLVENIIFKNYTKNKKYKATTLSIKSQINLFFSVIISFGITYFMGISYKLGFFILGIFLFLVLVLSFLFIKKK